MTDNVVMFNGITRLPLDPDRVLQEAVGKVKVVIIVGWDQDDQMYFASSEPDGPECLWLLEKAKQALLDVGN